MNTNGAMFADFASLTTSSASSGGGGLLGNGAAAAAGGGGTISATTTSSGSTPGSTTSDGNDHLQRLAAMTQGVGKEENDSTISSSAADLYPGFSGAAAYAMQGAYAAGWPTNYYSQFGQPLGPTPFSGWAPAVYPSAWHGYGSGKKGRQTYQRYQTSVLEARFQQTTYVSKKQREELRAQTNLTDRQIKIWFQNRRMKAKKEKQRVDDGTELPQTQLLPPSGHSSDVKSSIQQHQLQPINHGHSQMLENGDKQKWLETNHNAIAAANLAQWQMAASAAPHNMMLAPHHQAAYMSQYPPLCP